MTTNPNDYDPNELRGGSGKTGGAFLGSGGGGGFGPGSALGGDESLRANQFRELFLLQEMGDAGDMDRPYLETLPRSFGAEVLVFEWLEFLVDEAGFRRTMDVLRFYRSIDWITEPVETRLREYLTSFDDVGSSGDLDRSDHLTSLVYVARLASMD